MTRKLEEDIRFTAESLARNFADRGNFDFSIESLQSLDELLEEAGDFDLEEEQLDSISSMAGCYMFEVARRNFGGVYVWSPDRQQPVLITGEPDFSVSLFAFDKVRGRIRNGTEDNIPFYFSGYMQAVEKGRGTGYCATII
ncbi:hypothetical protein [Paenibacillus sp. A14]|uniref:hypothetical protein n=1 Tax=Paenibacillus sp. A14 TaxID=3119820 RepID=UPI002FE346D3